MAEDEIFAQLVCVVEHLDYPVANVVASHPNVHRDDSGADRSEEVNFLLQVFCGHTLCFSRGASEGQESLLRVVDLEMLLSRTPGILNASLVIET